jgi:Arc/MetJ-type ribon-helix-helix transcriptional regulator
MVFMSPDTEKITINMGAVDLGKVDLLVDEGFYGNRSDFIRTAIRNQLDRLDPDTTASIARRTAALGVLGISTRDLENALAQDKTLKIAVVGMLVFSSDVTPELAQKAIESVFVRGIFRASDEVKAALTDRMR